MKKKDDKPKKPNIFKRMGEDAELMLYVMGCTLAPAVILFFFFLRGRVHTPGCAFKSLTGWYCPGCGGTRSVFGFLQGHFLQSFYYNPFVPYVMVLYVVFMVRNTLHYIWPNKFKLMEFRTEYAVIALVLILGQWIIKNILAHAFGLYLC